MKPIRCGDYKQLCDFVFDADDIAIPPPSGIIYVPLDRINQFFNLLRKTDCKNKYVLVSARSDFGLAYQRQNPLWLDMVKWLPFVQNDESVRKLNYNPLIIPPRGKVDNCKREDTYSVKCYCFTEATFDEIPNNVFEWYCVNANISHPKVFSLPFGVQEQADTSLFDSLKDQKKFDALYVNFSNNTNERVKMANFFLNNSDIIPVEVAKTQKSYELYLQDISQFRYVLCPPGNGYDSYRVWETLYLGSIPVVIKDYWNEAFDSLPIIRLEEKELYTANLIDVLKSKEKKTTNAALLCFDNWRERFLCSRKQLLALV